jgi:hypothetical protein
MRIGGKMKVFKKIIIGIFGVAFFGFALVMTILLLNFNDFGVTQIDNKSLVIINDEITSEKYKKGDLVVVKGQKLSEIAVGDEIFAYKVDKNGVASIDLGKVGQVYQDEKAISFENGATYAIDYIVGKADKTYGHIGTYLSIIESKWGFLFIILVPSFLIFIYEIYALIVEVKYGKEEKTE